ncbi:MULTISPECIES: hypothetical protein [Methanothermobacter]|uniref:Transmembrane protein 7.7 kDa n=2 Tax=Methanothermobacter TaxID=145260 RepID=Q9UXQ0_METTF|nr:MULTISPECIES: hypothetical protein [Methanothermobacter]CAB52764.1 transmembrane protein 7.7 kDa [Methanothermobacter thermautotrophicus]ADL58387.1 energy-converting hydrogenase A, subunit I [Methanothermobacter marburgensis str. Marburg]QEF93754.1 DUF788 domain-containing protein [Methanothermobacter sp. KEPCO-1]QHN08795.1 DUF788 domain-containing protein [Methanothermobacter sp. THM-2]WBF10531.1 DUF788 domain-containing protein [Methanothermobacter marburgensis]
MNKLKAGSLTALILSATGIIYALLFNPPAWVVYGVAIFLIPVFILSLGILSMATPEKDEADERVNEPFIGY